MSVWTDVFEQFRTVMTDNTNFSNRYGNRFYIYSVAEDVEFPYLYIPTETILEQWMTIGDVMSGEEFTVRFTLHSHIVKADGVKDLDVGQTELSNEFHLVEDFPLQEYSLISMRRVRQAKPYRDPDNNEIYHSFIDFRTRIEKE